jgi:hypothetical protein
LVRPAIRAGQSATAIARASKLAAPAASQAGATAWIVSTPSLSDWSDHAQRPSAIPAGIPTTSASAVVVAACHVIVAAICR